MLCVCQTLIKKLLTYLLIFTVNFSTPAAQRRSQVKWLTPVKPEKNACPTSALFQCSLIQSDAADAAAADGKCAARRRLRS